MGKYLKLSWARVDRTHLCDGYREKDHCYSTSPVNKKKKNRKKKEYTYMWMWPKNKYVVDLAEGQQYHTG